MENKGRCWREMEARKRPREKDKGNREWEETRDRGSRGKEARRKGGMRNGRKI